jgi:hypothetical protein
MGGISASAPAAESWRRASRENGRPSKDAVFRLYCGCAGARRAPGGGEVPSSYRDYFGNQGFCYGIFRDITPIAAG